ncbi:thioredoxin family protein [Dactylosporangium sp. CA-092794]|uniref:thioredoxin family protein n=1 Tax=Dactylosporangium sp. CA-092794 TaxID=3239929 RepID=UPI003D8F7A2E
MNIPRWTPDAMHDQVATGVPVLVDLRADWCSQCEPQEQVLDRLLAEYTGTVTLGSVDVGVHPDIPDRYGVLGLPSFLLFTGGELRQVLNGYKRAPELRQALRDLLHQQA